MQVLGHFKTVLVLTPSTHTHHPPTPPTPQPPVQVLGHSKTILVLLGGWAFLGDTITPRKLGGMALAVAGMMW